MTGAPVDDQGDAAEPFPPAMFTSQRAALTAALGTTPRLPRDNAVVTLALTLADQLDTALDQLEQADEDDEARNFHRMMVVIDKLTIRYLQTLDRLGMSPGSRPAVQGGEGDRRTDPADGHLARLQGAATGAAAGQHPGAALDPAVAEALAGD